MSTIPSGEVWPNNIAAQTRLSVSASDRKILIDRSIYTRRGRLEPLRPIKENTPPSHKLQTYQKSPHCSSLKPPSWSRRSDLSHEARRSATEGDHQRPTFIPSVVGLKRIVGVAHLALRATRGTPSCIAAYAWELGWSRRSDLNRRPTHYE